MPSMNRPYVGRHVPLVRPEPGDTVRVGAERGRVIRKSQDGTAVWCLFGAEQRMFTYRLAAGVFREFPERVWQDELIVC